MQTNLREEELFCALLVKRGFIDATDAKRFLRELNTGETVYGQISNRLVSENVIGVSDVAKIEEFRQNHIILRECGRIFNVESHDSGNAIVCKGCKRSYTVPDRNGMNVRIIEAY